MITTLRRTSFVFWRDSIKATHPQLLALITLNFPLVLIAFYANSRIADAQDLGAALFCTIIQGIGAYGCVLAAIVIPLNQVNEQTGLRFTRTLMLLWLLSLLFFSHNAFIPLSIVNGPFAHRVMALFTPSNGAWALSAFYSIMAALFLALWTERLERHRPANGRPSFPVRCALTIGFCVINTMLFRVLIFEDSVVELIKTIRSAAEA